MSATYFQFFMLRFTAQKSLRDEYVCTTMHSWDLTDGCVTLSNQCRRPWYEWLPPRFSDVRVAAPLPVRASLRGAGGGIAPRRGHAQYLRRHPACKCMRDHSYVSLYFTLGVSVLWYFPDSWTICDLLLRTYEFLQPGVLRYRLPLGRESDGMWPLSDWLLNYVQYLLNTNFW